MNDKIRETETRRNEEAQTRKSEEAKRQGSEETKKTVTIGMLCALAYAAVLVGRIPVVLFLKYDPKDVVIVIGGLIFGPSVSLIITGIVSVAQMFTISGTGVLGCIMNIISSCSFACTAAFIYQRRRRLSGAVAALIGGCICQTGVMMLWNYLIAPIYMGYPREAVAALLLPAFLPFNLIKGGLNAAITMLLYKPVVTVLRRTDLISGGVRQGNRRRTRVGVVLAALMLLAACVLWILSLQKVI